VRRDRYTADRGAYERLLRMLGRSRVKVPILRLQREVVQLAAGRALSIESCRTRFCMAVACLNRWLVTGNG
jgi:hypothetical protein